MIFHPNIRNLMIGQGILAALSTLVGVTVYSGSQPTAAFIEANWSNFNATPLLHWTDVGFTQPLNGILASVTTFPAPVNALLTGTASWAIIWSTNVTAVQVAAGAIPSTSFIVCPVSISSGAGVIRLTNTSIVAGASTSLIDGSITATSS